MSEITKDFIKFVAEVFALLLIFSVVFSPQGVATSTFNYFVFAEPILMQNYIASAMSVGSQVKGDFYSGVKLTSGLPDTVKIFYSGNKPYVSVIPSNTLSKTTYNEIEPTPIITDCQLAEEEIILPAKAGQTLIVEKTTENNKCKLTLTLSGGLVTSSGSSACNDGTQVVLSGQCSLGDPPKYCDSGNLIEKCSQCGCPGTLDCQTDDSCASSPACNCGTWTNGACGAGGCASNQRQQTRTCTPSRCTPTDGLGNSQCVADSSCAGAVCGNGIIEGSEDCDGSNLNGKTCASLGYTGGTLKCANCMFDTSSCTGGAQFSVTVDSSNVIGANNLSLGFHLDWERPNYFIDPSRQAYRNLAEDANFKLVRVFDYRLTSSYGYANIMPCTSWNSATRSCALWNWTTVDALTNAIFSVGAEPLFVLGSAWAPISSRIPPGMSINASTGLPNPDDYAVYAAAWVNHFKQTVKSVRYYEILNEPYHWYDSPNPDPQKLKDVVNWWNAAARAMRAANPQIRISNDALTQKEMLDYWVNYGDNVDSLDFHKYDTGTVGEYTDQQMFSRAESYMFTDSSTYYSVDSARQIWYSKRGKWLPVINTEFNFNYNPDPSIQTMTGAVWTSLFLRKSMLEGLSYVTYFEFSDGPNSGPELGMIDYSNNKPWYPYYVNKIIGTNLAVGDSIASSSSNSGSISSIAWNDNGKLNILLIHRSTATETVSLSGVSGSLAYQKIDNTYPYDNAQIQTGTISAASVITLSGYTVMLLQTTSTPSSCDSSCKSQNFASGTCRAGTTSGSEFGFSSYPRTLDGTYSNATVQSIIDEMNLRGLTIYRMSVYWNVDPAPYVQYYLEHCNYDLIVARHMYPPGNMPAGNWTAAKDWSLRLATMFKSYEDRLWLEPANERWDTDLGAQIQTIVTALRNAGHKNPVVVNRQANGGTVQSWSSLNINDPLGRTYVGEHYYFTSGAWSSAESRLQQALDLGLKVFNTEIGADYNDVYDSSGYNTAFDQSEVNRVTSFLSWCAQHNVGSTVWQRYGLQNWKTYLELGMKFPTVSSSTNKNWVSIPNAWEGYVNNGYFVWNSVKNCFLDTSVEYNGNPSIRNEAVSPVSSSPNRELDAYNASAWPSFSRIAVKPGDTVVFTVWMKSDPSTIGVTGGGNSAVGGVFGLDLYGSQTRLWEVAWGYPATTDFNTVNYNAYKFLPYGSDWTEGTITITIPSKTFTKESEGQSIPAQTVTSIIPWISVDHDQVASYESAKVWFSDAELYINPSSGTCQSGETSIQDSCSSGLCCCSGTAPSCSCGSWTNGACGAGGCASNQRQQTRTCSPSGCGATSQCVADSTCGATAGIEVKGIQWFTTTPSSYSASAATQTLNDLNTAIPDFNYVYIDVWVNVSSDGITVVRDGGDAYYASAIQKAKALGKKVVIRVRQRPSPYTFHPANTDLWLKNYTKAVVDWASFSQQYGVEMFSIVNEFNNWDGDAYSSYWNSLISQVKNVYSGKIIANINNWDESQAQFDQKYSATWLSNSNLDYIAVSAYWPLCNNNPLTVNQLVNNWTTFVFSGLRQSYADGLKNISDVHGKKIIIITGLASANNTTAPACSAPWNGDPTFWQHTDLSGQNNWYEAVFRAFNDKPWIEGYMFDTAWFTYQISSPTTNMECTVQGKPAAATIEKWFGNTNMLTGINYLSNGNSWTESNSVLDSDFSRFSSDGIKHISVRMMWSVMEPIHSGTTTNIDPTALNNVERVLTEANRYGIKVNLDFWTQHGSNLGLPGWVGSYWDIETDQTIQDDYVSYMQAVVSQLKSYPAVESWTVMNEPWFGTGSNGVYAGKAQFQTTFPILYNAIKSADPNHIVTCRFALSTTPGSGKYDASVYNVFDVFSITVYNRPDELYSDPVCPGYGSTWAMYDKTVSDLNSLGKPLWVIEFGAASNQACYNNTIVTNAMQQAHYHDALSIFSNDGVNRAYAWAWQTGNAAAEAFNIYDGTNPKPAYYELTNYG